RAQRPVGSAASGPAGDHEPEGDHGGVKDNQEQVQRRRDGTAVNQVEARPVAGENQKVGRGRGEDEDAEEAHHRGAGPGAAVVVALRLVARDPGEHHAEGKPHKGAEQGRHGGTSDMAPPAASIAAPRNPRYAPPRWTPASSVSS